jgi:hypothetical protein
MFGCLDCADAEEEAKAQPTITKDKMNLLKILSLFEQKPDSTGDAAEPQFSNSPNTLEKSRRAGIAAQSSVMIPTRDRLIEFIVFEVCSGVH